MIGKVDLLAKIKIRCEAITRTSIKLNEPKRCKAKGYFVPTSKRMLCRFHGCSKTIDSKTRKYKGLYKNNNIPIQNKIKLLKNLKNFKLKSDAEIKQYIQDQEKLANKSNRYRTKFYTRHHLRWRNTSYRNQRHFKDQLDVFLQVLRSKSKV